MWDRTVCGTRCCQRIRDYAELLAEKPITIKASIHIGTLVPLKVKWLND